MPFSQTKDTQGIQPLKRTNGKGVAQSDLEKVEEFNGQFTDVFNKNENTQVPLLDRSAPFMNDTAVSKDGVIKLLKGLNPSKALGPDELHPRVLTELATELGPVFAHLFQQSIDTGEIPKEWSLANICPLFKKSDRSLACNYRPVSLTCVPCKLLEHIVCSNIMAHLDEYRKGHSCETQLTVVINDWAKILDNRGQVDTFILDFEKAFDTPPPPTKANLGFLRRNLHSCPQEVKEAAYKGLLRPVLDHGSSDPLSVVLQEELESVQKRAARFVTRNYNYETGSMTGILGQLKWESLKKRRKDNRPILLYKGLKGKASVPTDDLIPKTRRCRNQHSKAFQTPIANTDVYKGSFFPQTIRDWNALPDSQISFAEDAEDCVTKFTSLVRARD